jgi:hypothetical protein
MDLGWKLVSISSKVLVALYYYNSNHGPGMQTCCASSCLFEQEPSELRSFLLLPHELEAILVVKYHGSLLFSSKALVTWRTNSSWTRDL